MSLKYLPFSDILRPISMSSPLPELTPVGFSLRYNESDSREQSFEDQPASTCNLPVGFNRYTHLAMSLGAAPRAARRETGAAFHASHIAAAVRPEETGEGIDFNFYEFLVLTGEDHGSRADALNQFLHAKLPGNVLSYSVYTKKVSEQQHNVTQVTLGRWETDQARSEPMQASLNISKGISVLPVEVFFDRRTRDGKPQGRADVAVIDPVEFTRKELLPRDGDPVVLNYDIENQELGIEE